MSDAREELEAVIRDVYDPWSDTPSEIADAILTKFPGIRDLIEASEPCSWCPEPHRGFAEWQGDGKAHPSCGAHGHGYYPARFTEGKGDDD